jgi:hypothetical protein
MHVAVSHAANSESIVLTSQVADDRLSCAVSVSSTVLYLQRVVQILQLLQQTAAVHRS